MWYNKMSDCELWMSLFYGLFILFFLQQFIMLALVIFSYYKEKGVGNDLYKRNEVQKLRDDVREE